MKFKLIYIIYLIIAYTIIIFIKSYVESSRRQKYLVNLLKNRKLDSFLLEIDKDIDFNKETNYKYQLLIFKASGLINGGRFVESLDLLDKINIEKLTKAVKSNYYYNYIATLFYSGQIEEGEIMLRKNLELLRNKMMSDEVQYQINKFFAITEYHAGNFQKSGDIFNKVLQNSSNVLANAICNYYLGLIKIKQEDIENSKTYFEKAYKLGQGTFIENKVKDVLEEL